jgi:hypothetical protein
MSDLPLDKKSKKAHVIETSATEQVAPGKFQVTHENADLITVHFLSQIHGRLGYIVKLLEGKL